MVTMCGMKLNVWKQVLKTYLVALLLPREKNPSRLLCLRGDLPKPNESQFKKVKTW